MRNDKPVIFVLLALILLFLWLVHKQTKIPAPPQENIISTPMPGPTPIPVPKPEPMPEPAPAPVPQPIPGPRPKPMPGPEPAPMPEPAPIPGPKPMPGPIPPPLPYIPSAPQSDYIDPDRVVPEAMGIPCDDLRNEELPQIPEVLEDEVSLSKIAPEAE